MLKERNTCYYQMDVEMIHQGTRFTNCKVGGRSPKLEFYKPIGIASKINLFC